MKMAKTINDVLDAYKTRYDFNKRIGQFTALGASMKLADYFNNPKLKYDLKDCENLTQIRNVIEQKTGALSVERTPEELKKFTENFERIAKMAKL